MPTQTRTREELKTSGHHSKAGKKGGEKTKQKMLELDPLYYETIGHKGAINLIRKYGKDWFSFIGSAKGKGERTAEKFLAEQARKVGTDQ